MDEDEATEVAPDQEFTPEQEAEMLLGKISDGLAEELAAWEYVEENADGCAFVVAFTGGTTASAWKHRRFRVSVEPVSE